MPKVQQDYIGIQNTANKPYLILEIFAVHSPGAKSLASLKTKQEQVIRDYLDMSLQERKKRKRKNYW